LQAIRVAGDQPEIRVDDAGNLNLLCLHRRSYRIQRGVNHIREVGGTEIELELAGDHSRNVEDVFNHLLLRPGISLYYFQRMFGALTIKPLGTQHS